MTTNFLGTTSLGESIPKEVIELFKPKMEREGFKECGTLSRLILYLSHSEWWFFFYTQHVHPSPNCSS